ncbi:sugar phosphate isomerase/epimerase family protein [Peribacillus aracenensis]|uniref:sugar phosphate isomerase/epimerase family protein n=1 Tax=Peribacillus aracenensis TaxID=2976708 RepID=UPI0021A66B73|nr:sugar phosphate isomerase/epimerase family protein [Peribacillus sp. BBB004]
MKLSLCTTGFKEWDIEDIIKWLLPLQTDVKGLELWNKHIERFQEKHGPLDKLAKLLESNGLQIPSISGYTTFSKLWNENEHRNEFNQAKRLLDIAHQLNCPLIRTFAGHIASRNASPEQWSETATELKKIAQIADLYDVDVAVEIHYDTFADNIESIHKLLQDINHPRIKLIFDGANLYVDQLDPIEALDSVYSHVSHVHLKNYHYNHKERYKNKPAPIFEGDVDNVRLLEELRKRNYSGFVSLEYFGEEGVPNLHASLEQVRPQLTI